MGKYDHINFKPPASVAKEAARGLDLRDEYNRGGTDVGIQRARNLKNRDTISPTVIKKMYSFFSRHEVNKNAKGWKRGSEGYPSNGLIAWKLWGGDPGFAWSKKVRNQMEAADKKSKKGSVVPKSVRYRGATYQLVEADGYMTLYFIGKRPAKPVLKLQPAYFNDPEDPSYEREQLKKSPGMYDPGYSRPWLEEDAGPVVFLSDNPAGIWHNHGIRGNLYAYKVPMSVVKKSGGLHMFDHGREILIPEELWDQVQLIGKVPESKFSKLLSEYRYNYSPPRERVEEEKEKELDPEAAKKKLQQHSLWQKVEKRVEREQRRSKRPVNPNQMAQKFLDFVDSKFGFIDLSGEQLPIESNHRNISSLVELFNIWSARKDSRTGMEFSWTDPSLQSLREADPSFWEDQVKVIERRLFA